MRNGKIVIGLDVDGVLQNYYYYLVRLGSKITGYSPVKYDACDFESMFQCGITNDQFWDMCREEYLKNPQPMSDIILLEKFLASHKDTVEAVVITSRNYTNTDPQTITFVVNETGKFINKYLPSWSKVLFNIGESKAEVARAAGVDIMLEDEPHHIEALSNVCRVFVMDQIYNRHISKKDNIHIIKYGLDEAVEMLRLYHDVEFSKHTVST